jgi:hypothetical protein
VTCWLEAGIAELIYAAIAKQRWSKHISSETDATVEEVVFPIKSVPRLYNDGQLDSATNCK